MAFKCEDMVRYVHWNSLDLVFPLRVVTYQPFYLTNIGKGPLLLIGLCPNYCLLRSSVANINQSSPFFFCTSVIWTHFQLHFSMFSKSFFKFEDSNSCSIIFTDVDGLDFYQLVQIHEQSNETSFGNKKKTNDTCHWW